MANDRLMTHTQGEAIIAALGALNTTLTAVNVTLTRIAVALEPAQEESGESGQSGESGGEQSGGESA
ncbi:MAG: hypothetical protein IJQ81_01035 [Oscillibacter sp.]|nr:hypothetical protein [Oscillibacter sp.]